MNREYVQKLGPCRRNKDEYRDTFEEERSRFTVAEHVVFLVIHGLADMVAHQARPTSLSMHGRSEVRRAVTIPSDARSPCKN